MNKFINTLLCSLGIVGVLWASEMLMTIVIISFVLYFSTFEADWEF